MIQMETKFKIAKMNLLDIESVRKLFKKVFEREITEEYFSWLYSNPAGKPIGNVARIGNKVIGLYILIPVTMKAGSNEVKVAISVSSMVHPQYRGQGIFGTLSEKTFREATDFGIKFIYGFPNEISYPLFLKKGWVKIRNISFLEKTFNSLHEKKKENIEFEAVDEFGDELGKLWERSKKFYDILRIRDNENVNWRFENVKIYNKHPRRDYRKIVCKENGTLVGYVIIKFYTDGKEKKSHIVDILSKEKDTDIMFNMFLHAINYSIKKGYKKISCWEPNEKKLLNKLLSLGFQKKRIQPFLVSSLPNNDMKNWHNWHITMGDSDVF